MVNQLSQLFRLSSAERGRILGLVKVGLPRSVIVTFSEPTGPRAVETGLPVEGPVTYEAQGTLEMWQNRDGEWTGRAARGPEGRHSVRSASPALPVAALTRQVVPAGVGRRVASDTPALTAASAACGPPIARVAG